MLKTKCEKTSKNINGTLIIFTRAPWNFRKKFFFPTNKNKTELLANNIWDTVGFHGNSISPCLHSIFEALIHKISERHSKYLPAPPSLFQLILSPEFFQWHFNLFLGRASQYWVVKSTVGVEEIDVAEKKLFAEGIWLIFNILWASNLLVFLDLR